MKSLLFVKEVPCYNYPNRTKYEIFMGSNPIPTWLYGLFVQCRFGQVLLLIFTIAVVGCSTTHISDLSKQPYTQGEQWQEQNGLRIGVAPLTDVAEISLKFGTNLIGNGVLPVFIVVKNNSATNSFLVVPDKFRLMAMGTTHEQTRKKPKSLWAGGAAQLAGAVSFSPLFIGVGAIIATDTLTANHQLTVNKLGMRTLSPFSETAGYLYFKIPNPASTLEDCALVVEIPNSSTRASIIFQFPLHITTD
jgi:hypothetical protein